MPPQIPADQLGYGQPVDGRAGYGMVPPSYGSAPLVYGTPQPKSIAVAAVLAFFLGGLGIHNFYLGHVGRAVAQLILTIVGWATSWLFVGFFLIGAVGIWVLVEFILILARSGSYARDARGVPLT